MSGPTKIGFIGLGRMGRGMASNLCRAGFAVTGYDLRPEAVRHLVAEGARGAANVAEAVSGADIVITMLLEPASVREVMADVFAHAAAGTLVMDMSTVDPGTTDALAAGAAARGLAFVDAPVGRTPAEIARAEALIMAGASDADFARVRPLFEAMGRTIHHCGPPGAGTRTKLVVNSLVTIACQLNAEALNLAQHFGLDLAKTLEVIHGTTATNGQLASAWPQKVLRGEISAGFRVDLAHKDLALVVEAGQQAGIPMPVAAAARQAYEAALAMGFGGNDFSAMSDVLSERAGVDRVRLPPGPTDKA